MTRAAIMQSITGILSELLEIDDLRLSEDTAADSVENWDSINHVRLLIGLESELGIQFETDEVSGIANVGGLIDLVHKKLASK